jgi:hypothetical protein
MPNMGMSLSAVKVPGTAWAPTATRSKAAAATEGRERDAFILGEWLGSEAGASAPRKHVVSQPIARTSRTFRSIVTSLHRSSAVLVFRLMLEQGRVVVQARSCIKRKVPQRVDLRQRKLARPFGLHLSQSTT